MLKFKSVLLALWQDWCWNCNFFVDNFIDPLLFLVIPRSPKTCSQNIATSNLFQAQFHFYFRFYHTKVPVSQRNLIDKQVKRNVLTAKKYVTFRGKTMTPILPFIVQKLWFYCSKKMSDIIVHRSFFFFWAIILLIKNSIIWTVYIWL